MFFNRFDDGGTPHWRARHRMTPARRLAGPAWEKWTQPEKIGWIVLLPFRAFLGFALGLIAVTALLAWIGAV